MQMDVSRMRVPIILRCFQFGSPKFDTCVTLIFQPKVVDEGRHFESLKLNEELERSCATSRWPLALRPFGVTIAVQCAVQMCALE